MCCRVVISEVDERSYRDSLKDLFNVVDDSQMNFNYSYNISPGSFLPVVYKNVVIKASNMKWGLVPFTNSKYKNNFFNTRIETADIKISFKDSFKNRRCIIPISGYYEWRQENGVKQPYYFFSTKNKILPLAGLYKQSFIDGKAVSTFTILTKPSEGDLQTVHDRMPVILTRDLFEEWLNSKDIDLLKKLVTDNKEQDIRFYKVSTNVNSVRNDSRTLINKID